MEFNFTNFIERTSNKMENFTGAVLFAVFAKGEHICSHGKKDVEKRARLKRNNLRSSNH